MDIFRAKQEIENPDRKVTTEITVSVEDEKIKEVLESAKILIPEIQKLAPAFGALIPQLTELGKVVQEILKGLEKTVVVNKTKKTTKTVVVTSDEPGEAITEE